MKILILCTGNSCRSQMAHGFLQAFDTNLVVRSAGTEPADQINPEAVKAMKESGIDISGHKPVSVQEYIHDEWDYVITVCDQANETCPVFFGKVKYRVHMGFEDPSRAKGSPDFVQKEYRRIRDEIKKTFYHFWINTLY